MWDLASCPSFAALCCSRCSRHCSSSASACCTSEHTDTCILPVPPTSVRACAVLQLASAVALPVPTVGRSQCLCAFGVEDFEIFIFLVCLYLPHLCLATPAGLIDSFPVGLRPDKNNVELSENFVFVPCPCLAPARPGCSPVAAVLACLSADTVPPLPRPATTVGTTAVSPKAVAKRSWLEVACDASRRHCCCFCTKVVVDLSFPVCAVMAVVVAVLACLSADTEPPLPRPATTVGTTAVSAKAVAKRSWLEVACNASRRHCCCFRAEVLVTLIFPQPVPEVAPCAPSLFGALWRPVWSCLSTFRVEVFENFNFPDLCFFTCTPASCLIPAGVVIVACLVAWFLATFMSAWELPADVVAAFLSCLHRQWPSPRPRQGNSPMDA